MSSHGSVCKLVLDIIAIIYVDECSSSFVLLLGGGIVMLNLEEVFL